MTTQTVLCNLYDYGAATVTVTVHDPATLVLTDTANTVTKNGVNGSRYAAVFTRVSVLPAGVYAVGVVVNGVPGLLYATLAGVDGEVVSARSEIAVELDSATSQKIDSILQDTGTTLPGLIGDIEGGGGLTGPYTRTVTVTDADTDEPIEAAKVRLYRTGETGTEATDGDGIASFTVEAATWSYGVTASGYTGVSGTVVVSANGNTPVQMEAVSITPPSNPSLSAIVVLCLDAAGQPEPDVDIDIRIVSVPSGSQNIAYKGAKQTATSDDDGIARFEVVQGSVCEWKRGRADVWSRVTIDSDSVTNVTSVIGSP